MREQPAPLARRGVAGADADRRHVGERDAGRSAACAMPASGARRFFSTSTASARRGEMYRTRVRSFGRGRRLGREPVDRPQERRQGLARAGRRQEQRVVAAAIGGHPCDWAAVGASNEASNQAADRGGEGSSSRTTRYAELRHVTAAAPARAETRAR